MRRVILPWSSLSAAQQAGTVPALGGSGCVTWHSTLETSGSSAASYTLWDGPHGAGLLLMTVSLSAGQSTRDFIGLHALPYVNGLYVQVVSGAIAGTVTAWADHVCEDWYRADWAVKMAEGAAALAALGAG